MTPASKAASPRRSVPASAKATPATPARRAARPDPGTLTPSGRGNLASPPPPAKTSKKTVKCKKGFVKKKVKNKDRVRQEPRGKVEGQEVAKSKRGGKS